MKNWVQIIINLRIKSSIKRERRHLAETIELNC